MEDLQNRLQFDNTSVKRQAVRRLVELICAKQGKLGQETQELPELELLWSKCGDEDPVTSLTCSAALVVLVQRRRLDFGKSVRRLVNLAPSARNLAGILTALTDLMGLQMAAMYSQDNYNSPYSIRNSPHPFITVVTNRPDCWPLLQQQLLRLLTWAGDRVNMNAVQQLEPFLKFILLEPRQSPCYLALRTTLVAGVLQEAPRHITLRVVKVLMDILACMQIDCTSSLGEVLSWVNALVTAVRDHCDLSCLRTMSSYLLDLAVAALKHGLDTGQLLRTLSTLIADHPESICGGSHMFQMIELLSSSSERQWTNILRVVKCYTCQPMDCFIAGTLVLPLLSVLATATSSAARQLACDVLRQLEKVIGSDNKEGVSVYNEYCLRPETYSYEAYTRLASHFSHNEAATADWLTRLKATSHDAGHVTCQLTSLVASILVVSNAPGSSLLALDVLTVIAAQAPSQVPDLLPLLVYKLGRETRSEVKLAILHTMAKTATHKVATVPVLRTFQMLAMSPSLKPVVLRLVTSLWKQQDRCFPHLQKMLAESGSDSGCGKADTDEGLIARAASIRDICETRPHQHGADMLILVSAILNDYTNEDEAVAVAMALEGLRYLCEAEVVDVRSAWSVLAAKLQHDQRSLVMCELCRLFSLVPDLEVATREYEVFVSQVVDLLWTYTKSRDLGVASAAFTSLAKFTPLLFTPQHLPDEIRPDLEGSTETDDGDCKDVVPSHITGDQYIRLMHSLPQSLVPAYTRLQIALVQYEVSSAPRGTFQSHTSRTANPNKALGAIPECIQSRYNRNPPPELRPSLALGLLLAYDPSVPVGRDGKCRRQHIVQHGRSYHQMLYTLMNEVSVSLSEWRELLLLPQAWTLFMQRCFSAYLEGYSTELVLQLEQGQVNDLEENQLRQNTAWLWTRDKLFELIKSTSRGRPAVQANAVIALSGLATTVAKYASGLSPDATEAGSKVAEHLGTPHWLSMVINTVLSILDVNFKPSSRIFYICQQRGSSRDTNPSPLLARAAAALAVSELVLIVSAMDTTMVGTILETLSGAISTEASSPLNLSHNLALGMTVARLFDEHFLDITGTQGVVAVWKAVGLLEKAAFGAASESVGALVGVTLCLVSMCREGAASNIAHVRVMQEQLTTALEFTAASDSNYQVLCQCVASVTASAYTSNIKTHQDTDQLVAKLYTAHIANTENASLSCALGVMCHGLFVAGHPTVTDMVDSLVTTWMSSLTDEEAPVLRRSASLQGLTALMGSHALSRGDVSHARLPLSQLVKSLRQLLQSSGDAVIQSLSATSLGQLYMCGSVSVTDHRSTVPSSYHYLAEGSILRSVVDELINAGKQGPEATSIPCVEACVKSLLLEGATSLVLPPVNWASVLTPLLRMPFGSEVEKSCLQVTVQQGAVVPSAALLLSSWLLPPLYDSLHGDGQTTLLDSLPTLIKTIPVQKLGEFFEHGFRQSFVDNAPGEGVRMTALTGLWGALSVPSPPPAVTRLLHHTLQDMFTLWTPKWVKAERTALCRCLTQVPDDVIDEILLTDPFDDAISPIFIRCYLVATGNQPLSWLNTSIEAAICSVDMKESRVLSLFTQCFFGCDLAVDKHANAMKRLNWLLELMGYMKSVATQSGSEPSLSHDQLLEGLMLVFAAAVVIWAGSEVSLPLAVTSFETYDDGVHSGLLAELLPRMLPHALCVLLRSQPWSVVTGKVIDWLLSLHGAVKATENENLLTLFKQCLYSLRHSEEFRKTNTWTTVYSLT